MNAFHRSAQGMAATLANIGRQRPHQEVRVLNTLCSGSVLGPRYDVCVGGEYYSVREITLQQLRLGVTPEELELSPIEGSYQSDYSEDDQDCSASDRIYQEGREL
jgi:hypothetical protein